jgi:hypothetical protein
LKLARQAQPPSLIEPALPPELLLELLELELAPPAPPSPMQAPLVQVPSGHDVSSGAFVSAGHCSDFPVQLSGASQTLVDARHSVPIGTSAHSPSTIAPVAIVQARQSVGSPLPHSESQQMPSVQKPLTQSSGDSQASLFACRRTKT